VGGLSFTHFLLLAIILIVLFGPSRLPQLGSSLGKAIRGFKDAMNELDGDARDLPPQQKPLNQVPHQQQQQISQQQTTAQPVQPVQTQPLQTSNDSILKKSPLDN
jgi:sec-independent protein translocase protein TatA